LLDSAILLSKEALVNQVVQLPLLYPIILIIGGPLGEEIGWRGYVLPRLLKQKSGLAANGIIFLMWTVWHLPLFWLEGSFQQGTSIATFLVVVATVLSIVYLGLYWHFG